MHKTPLSLLLLFGFSAVKANITVDTTSYILTVEPASAIYIRAGLKMPGSSLARIQ